MIDLHSHLLYSVDDGAATLEESLDLARMAVEDGIRVAVMTPHVHPGRYANRRSELEPRIQDFREALDAAGIPLEVRLGAEVRIGIESLELLLDDEVPFVGMDGKKKVMLLEFPHANLPVGSQQFIEKLVQMDIRPLIAHPERNKAIMAQPQKLVALIEAGCWLQLTAASLAGKFGDQAYETAALILRNNWAHVIASDAHNRDHRPPLLSEGRAAAAALVGEAIARQMVEDRPARILGL